MSVIAVLRRPFAPNPRLVTPTHRESLKLDAAGIQHPILRSYLVWRRSLMIFTLVATMLSSAISTYLQATDSDERPHLFSTITDRVSEEVPELPGLPKSDSPDEDEETAKEVAASGHGLKTDTQRKPATGFGKFADIVQLVALYSLQATAFVVVLFWNRFQRTYQIMVAAFAFSFLAPIAVGFCPWSWWGDVEPTYSVDKEPLEFIQSAAEGLLEATEYLVMLLPTVLSLIPAVQRSCIRVKLLLPQSILPGWFLVLASPFYSLFLLVVFVALNQVDSDPLLVIGFLLFLGAPLIYVFKAPLYVRPVATDDDARNIRFVQRLVGVLTMVAAILLLVFLSTRKAFGVHLLGLDPTHALVVPMDLVEFAFEVLSRSMFVTALGADVLMRMNLAVWQNEREFSRSAEKENYDAVMEQFAQIR